MKRTLLALSLAFCLGLSLCVSAAAYQPYEVAGTAAGSGESTVDVMVEDITSREGVKVPSQVHKLSNGSYTGSFTYCVLVYGNRLLETSTGTIKATVNSSVKQLGGNQLSNIQTVELIKKQAFGTTKVATKQIPREGKTTVNFINLEKNNAIYFLSLSKANDGTYLTGTISAAQ